MIQKGQSRRACQDRKCAHAFPLCTSPDRLSDRFSAVFGPSSFFFNSQSLKKAFLQHRRYDFKASVGRVSSIGTSYRVLSYFRPSTCYFLITRPFPYHTTIHTFSPFFSPFIPFTPLKSCHTAHFNPISFDFAPTSFKHFLNLSTYLSLEIHRLCFLPSKFGFATQSRP